jgi:pimeloyl-ACP methyl ester carboxylesterase
MGDITPIRDLGYMAWKNNLSWMESQKGSRWNAVIQKENRQFTEALSKIRPLVRKFVGEMREVVEPEPTLWRGWTVTYQPYSPLKTWTHGDFSVNGWDADMDKKQGLFAVAVPEGGYERFRLQVIRAKDNVVVHEVSKVGPSLAFLNVDQANVLVYLGSDKDTRYNTVCTWNYDAVGNPTKILYTIPNGQEDCNLEIRRVEDGSVAVVKTDMVTESLGYIESDKVAWVSQGFNVIPLARDTWIKNGKTSLGLPDEYLESISLKGGWAVTRSHGIRTIWKLGNVEKAEATVFVWGEVGYDVKEPDILNITDVRYEPYTIRTKGRWSLTPTKPHPFVCSYYNTKAPCFVVQGSGLIQPRGFLVTAYGAYGTPTKVGNLVKRWRPLLNRGWAIASVAVPGSGDHDEVWRNQGRRTNRLTAVETLCEAIRDLQEELGVPAKATALYGRSAGGLLVAAAVNKEPGLVGALYVESPFVDGLRTLTNLELPLSVIESKEFGLGTNPLNVMAMSQVSPMEHIPADGHPGLFVVARTDMADLEVYPYEVVKYITRLRGPNKLLYVSKNRGHFTTDYKTRAEDLALLEGWLSNPKSISKSKRQTRRKTESPFIKANFV